MTLRQTLLQDIDNFQAEHGLDDFQLAAKCGLAREAIYKLRRRDDLRLSTADKLWRGMGIKVRDQAA